MRAILAKQLECVSLRNIFELEGIVSFRLFGCV